MTENSEASNKEVQPTKEQTAPRKPDGVLTMKIGKQAFVTEVFFDHDSKDTFQDKLIKTIRSEQES
jgi:hypothetical protein